MNKLEIAKVNRGLERLLNKKVEVSINFGIRANFLENIEKTKATRKLFVDLETQKEKERIALCEELAKKYKNGKAILIDNVYQFTQENRIILETKVKLITEQYEEAIKKLEEEETDIKLKSLTDSQKEKVMEMDLDSYEYEAIDLLLKV